VDSALGTFHLDKQHENLCILAKVNRLVIVLQLLSITLVQQRLS